MNRCFFYWIIFIGFKIYSQEPDISYTSPAFFEVNQSITPLVPVNNGGNLPSEPLVSTIAGTGIAGFLDGSADNAMFYYPTVIVKGGPQKLIIVDRSNHRIRKIEGNVVYTLAGTGSIGSLDGPALSATFKYPDGAVVDSQGAIFITDQSNHKIRKIGTDGQVITYAGTGIAGYQDGNVLQAQFYYPAAMAIDSNDNLYIADYGNHRIRKITPMGIVSTIAGNGISGLVNGIADQSEFNGPTGLVVQENGDVYVCDYGNHCIRKIDASGIVSTFAGTGISGNTNGAANVATFNHPAVITANVLGAFYVTDEGNHLIRKISSDGTVSTYAGTGIAGSTEGLASVASFNGPTGIVSNNEDEIFIADYGNHKIRKITRYRFSVYPSLPSGLVLDPITGVISGTPNSASPLTDYTITATNEYGSDSFILSIEVGSLDIPFHQEKENFIYPNPVEDCLFLITAQTIDCISIFDSFGRIIVEKKPLLKNKSFDLSAFNSGIYFLKVEWESGVEMIMFQKN